MNQKSQNLKGKVILVMGATSGIGLAAAETFLNHGASVVGVGNEQQKLDSAQASLRRKKIAWIQGDAVLPETASRAVDLAVTNFGRLDGLFHVAGGSGRAWGDGPLHEFSDEGWRKTLDMNLSSVAYSNRAVLQQFLKQKTGGSIVNLSSVLAFSPSPKYFGTVAYSTSKAAIIGLSRSAASYYAPENIRVNVLAPGLVASPMSQRAQQNSEIMRFVKKKQPLDGGRIGLPLDLMGAATFLMSDDSKFVTGQVLSIDGGWSVVEGH